MTDDEFYKVGMEVCKKVVPAVRKFFPHEGADDILSRAYEALVKCKPRYDPSKGRLDGFVYISIRNQLLEQSIAMRRVKKRIPLDLIGSIDAVTNESEGETLSGYDALPDEKYDDIDRIILRDLIEQILTKINDPALVEVFIMLADGFTVTEIINSGLYGKSLNYRITKARKAIYAEYGIRFIGDEEFGTPPPKKKKRVKVEA